MSGEGIEKQIEIIQRVVFNNLEYPSKIKYYHPLTTEIKTKKGE